MTEQVPRDAITVEISPAEILPIGLQYPQQNQDATLSELNRLLTSCTKLVWDKHWVECHTNNAGAGVLELEGPEPYKYLCRCCCCQCGQLTLHFTNQGIPFLNFTHTPEMCTTCCCSGLKQMNVFVPGRLEPIGKVEYTNGKFTSKIVTITNFVTGEIFTARKGVSQDSARPNMLVQNQAGTTVATCAVTRAHTEYRRTDLGGTTTYKGVEVQFVPEVGMASTTKALMIIFGSALQMDKEYKNMCKLCTILLFVVFFVLACVLVGLHLRPAE